MISTSNNKFFIYLSVIITSIILITFSCNGCSSSKITSEKIEQDIVGRSMGGFLDGWTFAPEEPRKIEIIKEGYQEEKATLIVFIKTKSGDANGHPYSGQVRLTYNWIGSDWDLVEIEDLSFKRER